MQTKYDGRSVVTTFVIGLVAGIAPFLFMKLLPVLLHPSLQMEQMNYVAMAVTGLLIGAITAILFGSSEETRSSQDIFFYALGIPAILIATVTNLTTEFRAADDVSAARASASNFIMNQPKVEELKTAPQQISMENKGDYGLISSAWADERGSEHPTVMTKSEYFVVIGTYTSQEEVDAAYKKYMTTKLRAETYVQKALTAAKAGKDQYILIFSRHRSQETAQKNYQLIKINDPEIPVRLLKY